MAIRHDGIIPYLEIGRVCFHAFVPDMRNFNVVDLTITKNVSNRFVKIFEMYNKTWHRQDLINFLEIINVEKIFDLERVLTKVETAQLNDQKQEIIDYLNNLETQYK